MFKNIMHHRAASCNDCAKLCCTKVENFSVRIGNLTIFENVNLHLHCGQLTALIGPNGAGKSTLLKAILGEVEHKGSLQYTAADGRRKGQPIIGYVPQYLRFDVSAPISVMDIFLACLTDKPVWLTSGRKMRPRILKNLARVHAEHLIDRRLGALSGGELQRVLLALALDPLPDLLLLDEPVSGVDQNGLELFYEILAELREQEDMSILLISHDLNMVARHADQVVLLKKAVVTSGTPEEVFADKRTKQIFGLLAGFSQQNEQGGHMG